MKVYYYSPITGCVERTSSSKSEQRVICHRPRLVWSYTPLGVYISLYEKLIMQALKGHPVDEHMLECVKEVFEIDLMKMLMPLPTQRGKDVLEKLEKLN